MVLKTIYFVALVDLFCIAMIIPLIVPVFLSYGGSVFLSGILESVCAGLQFINAPIVGSWSDNVGRKSIFFYTLAVSMLGNVLLISSSSLMVFVLARILNGAFHHVQVLNKAIAVDIIPEKEQITVFNTIGALTGLAFTLGPIVGAHLYATHGDFYYIVIITNTLYLICLGAVALLDETKPTAKHKKSKSGIFQNISQINWSIFWDVFLFKLASELASSFWRSAFGILLREDFEIPTKSLGYVIGFISINTILANILMPVIRSKFYADDQNGSKQIYQSTIVQGVCFIIMAFTKSFPLYLLFCILMIFSKTLLDVVLMKILLGRIQDKDRGVIIGISDSIMPLSNLISPLTVGLVSDFINLKTAQYLPLIGLAISVPLIDKITS